MAGGGTPQPYDVLSSLAASEICTSASRCYPGAVARDLHRDTGTLPGVRLPLRATSRLYLRVPPSGALEIELQALGVVLAVAVAPEGGAGAAQDVFRTNAADASTTATIDLRPWAGALVRLDFRPVRIGSAGEPTCTVRRLALRGGGDSPAAFSPPLSRPMRQPNVVLYVVDTLRADHLGCYGYARPTSPRFDQFAAAAVRFDDAVAQSSWTLPAIGSILTGLVPPRHGASAVGAALRPDVPTVAQLLAAGGYRTAGFVTNYLGASTFGYDRGFNVFHLYEERANERPGIYLSSSVLFRRVRRWLARADRAVPFFLYVHATDPHWPYLPPERYARRFRAPGTTAAAARAAVEAARPYFFGHEHHRERPTSMPAATVPTLRDLYDGEIRLADDFFGRLLDVLAERGLADDTLVVLTADHGEEFLDHQGLGHGQTLHQEMLHVPLLVRRPHEPTPGAVVATTVAEVDILPTVLEAAGIAVPSGLDGRSLFRPGDDPDEPVSHLDSLGIVQDAVTTPAWRAIRELSEPVDGPAPVEVFDRLTDRTEHRDRAGERPIVAGYARQRLREIVAAGKSGPVVDPALLERLRQLGYLTP